MNQNEHNDWINQRSDVFPTLRTLASAAEASSASIFLSATLGLNTCRDVWCFHSSSAKLKANIRRSIDFYNEQVEEFQDSKPAGNAKQRVQQAKAFLKRDDSQFHWNRKQYNHAAGGRRYQFDVNNIRVALYRPFFKQRLYFDRQLNDNIRKFPEMYPNPCVQNLGISITGLGSNSPFHTLMTDSIPEYCLTAVNSIYFPRYRYDS